VRRNIPPGSGMGSIRVGLAGSFDASVILFIPLSPRHLIYAETKPRQPGHPKEEKRIGMSDHRRQPASKLRCTFWI